MAKPTRASVTEEPCKCGVLELAAKDPRSHIVFDSEVNEYHFRYPHPIKGNPSAMGSMVIYHCFFCGGAAPASKRTGAVEPARPAASFAEVIVGQPGSVIEGMPGGLRETTAAAGRAEQTRVELFALLGEQEESAEDFGWRLPSGL
jgi:hypothetical protein